jgi:hypothetical protein
MTLILLYSLFISFYPGSLYQQDEIQVRKIWDKGQHNAFTDLISFRNSYYCVFREGSGHIPGTDGVIRVLRSADLVNWESVALLEKTGIDLRDAKLSETPDGRLMVIMGGSIYKNGKLMGRSPQVSFSDHYGSEFSAPEQVEIDPELVSWGDWIWRVTWHKGTGYGIDYQIGPQERKGPVSLCLFKTKDGKKFEKVSKIDMNGFPNEATIRFDHSGKMYVLIRRELDDQMGVWAVSSAPYTRWKFVKLDQRLGGPNFLFAGKGRVIMGTRVYQGKEYYTGLFLGNKAGNFHEILKLPSAGDNSYPGLVLENNRLIVSYYSSHENKTAIYLAILPIHIIKP